MTETAEQSRIQRLLLDVAARLESTDLGERAAPLLSTTAAALREAAALYGSDPTLDRCPTGRDRPFDLLAELGRQLRPLLKNAVTGQNPERWPIEQRWAEAEALVARVPVILEECRSVVLPDPRDPDALRALSTRRLMDCNGMLGEAADRVRRAVAPALALEHPDPRALQILTLSEALEEHRRVLDAEWEAAEAAEGDAR